MSLNGIDISSWQRGIDLSVVPCDFVIVKATGGTGYVNPDCDRAVQQAIQLGKKVGVYHFARETGCAGSAVAEADYFVNKCQGYVGKAVLVLDWEQETNLGVSWAKRWLDRVREKTGINPMIYMSNSVVRSFDWSEVAKDYALWNAGYYAYGTPMGYNPGAPLIGGTGAWNGAAIYQYTSEGRLSGWNRNLDLNVFYGDVKAWDRYAGKSAQNEEKVISINATVQENSGDDCMRLSITDAGDGYFYIRDKANGLYLDAAGGASEDGTNVQFYKGNKSDAQKWKLIGKKFKQARYLMLSPKCAPDKFLSVENNGADGKNNLKLWSDLHNQKQKFYAREEPDGYTLLIHAFSGKCVSAKN